MVYNTSLSEKSLGSLKSMKSYSKFRESETPVVENSEWKHICPCDVSTPQGPVSISTQCLCEEVFFRKEFTLYFFNTIMEKLFIKEFNIFKDEYEPSISTTDEVKPIQKDIRKLSQEDMKKSLYAAGGNQLIMKKPKRSETKNIKTGRRVSKNRKSMCQS